MSSVKNRYWIPNLDINKKVITQEIQYYLGPESTVRPYTREGEDGFLITTPGECLTDEQIDDICHKSKEVWEKQAASRSKKESDKQLRRPLHQPIVVSRGSARSRDSILGGYSSRRNSESRYSGSILDTPQRYFRRRCDDSDTIQSLQELREVRCERDILRKNGTVITKSYDNTALGATHTPSNSLGYSSVQNIESALNVTQDMNDPVVLGLYTQLVLFQHDVVMDDTTFENPDHSAQDILHSLARKLGLEYEYSLCMMQVRISKPTPANREEINLMEFDQSFLNDFNYYLNNSSTSNLEPLLNDANPTVPNLFSKDSHWQSNDELFGIETLLGDNHDMLVPVSAQPVNLEVLPTLNPITALDLRSIDPSVLENLNESSEPSILGNHINSDTIAAPSGAIVSPLTAFFGPGGSNPGSTDICENHDTSLVSKNYVFVSDPTATTANIQYASARGRMDATARAGLKAVKTLGACWKCKVLRKKCDLQICCSECLRGERGSIWKIIGCRRGPLDSQIPRIVFCPKNQSEMDQMFNLLSSTKPALYGSLECVATDILWKDDARSGKDLPGLSAVDLNHLETYILWALENTSKRQPLLDDGELSESDFIVLVKSAVETFGASLKGTIVGKSLKCLHSCLEIVRYQASGHSTGPGHDSCTAILCDVTCMQKFQWNLKEYLYQLSAEMFKKKNLRGEKDWWLPTFYSLCIQSFVGRILATISAGPEPVTRPKKRPFQYLQLAVRLFTTILPGYDPIVQDQSTVDGADFEGINVKLVAMIRKSGTNSSGYLKHLFRMD